jgi:uncharacterized protein (TIGR01777 family)
MRVVVSGSSGFVGTALCSELRRAGHEVVRLVRREPAAAGERAWDPATGWLDAGALDGADAVVNLCGAGIGTKRWSGAYKQLIRDSRIEPTDVLARAGAERGVPVLVNGSATGYYGQTGAVVVDERAPAGSDFLAEVCRDWEAATRPASDAGVRVVLLRTGVVLGASGGLLGRLLPVFRRGLGGRLGSGRQYLSWVSMADQLGAIQLALESDRMRGPVNVTSPAPVTNAVFTRELAAVLRRPAPWVVPRSLLRLVLGEFAEDVLGSQRVVPRMLPEHGYRFVYPSLRSALEAALRSDTAGEPAGVRSDG